MSKKRALQNQGQAYFYSRLRNFGRGSLLLVATLLSFLAAVLLATDYLYQPQRFLVEKVRISGKFRHSSPQQVEASLANLKFGNFFSLELNAVKNRLEKLPWVERADIRRQWPDTLAIEVTEHRPVMLWRDNSQSKNGAPESGQLWLTSKGKVIDTPDSLPAEKAIRLRGNRYYAKVILDKALRWKKSLAMQDLKLLQVSQSETQSWILDMRFGNDGQPFEVLLGSYEVEARLARFKYLFDEQFRFSNYQLQRVDARYPNGLAVKHINLEPTLQEQASEQG